jgi:multiple sugar transport system permease protein
MSSEFRIVRKAVLFLVLWLPLLAYLAFLLFPLAWMFLTSIKTQADIYASPAVYWPSTLTFKTYQNLFGYFDFFRYLKNSMIIAAMTVAVSLFVSTLAAYAFARYRFKGRTFLLGLFLSNNMFPIVLLMIPLYSIMRKMGFLHTLSGMVIAYTTFTIPFSVWLIQGFIRDIPSSIEEAAVIDGCTRIQAFLHVFLPLLTPGLLAAGVYMFMQAWNEYTMASLFTNPATRTVPVALNSLIGQLGVEWDMLSGGGTLAVIPVCVMFFIAQRRLISGLTAGAVKG